MWSGPARSGRAAERPIRASEHRAPIGRGQWRPCPGGSARRRSGRDRPPGDLPREVRRVLSGFSQCLRRGAEDGYAVDHSGGLLGRLGRAYSRRNPGPCVSPGGGTEGVVRRARLRLAHSGRSPHNAGRSPHAARGPGAGGGSGSGARVHGRRYLQPERRLKRRGPGLWTGPMAPLRTHPISINSLLLPCAAHGSPLTARSIRTARGTGGHAQGREGARYPDRTSPAVPAVGSSSDAGYPA